MANCRIRIYVTCDANGNPIPSELGHFDLQFDGNYTIDGRAFTNPVFSYVPDSANRGLIKVFNAARTATVFADQRFKAYTFSFSANNVTDVIARIGSYLNAGHGAYITSNAYQYNVISGPFVTYDLSSTNCFAATATFASWLGYNTLRQIYNDAGTNYQSYSAYNMWRQYGGAWEYHGFYG